MQAYNDESEVMHKYYKGLRQIDVTSHSEYVAWTNMQLCFRGREEAPLEEHTAEMFHMIIGLYGKAFEEFSEIRPLSLGGDFFHDARYGLDLKMNYRSGKKEKDTIIDMLYFLLAIDSADKLYQLFMRRVQIEGICTEEIKSDCKGLIEELKLLQPEIKEFLRLVEEENRYVLVRQVY